MARGFSADAPVPKHRFYVDPDQVAGDRVRFSPEQSRQLTTVLRARAGARVRVFDGAQARDLVVEVEKRGGVFEGRCVGEVAQRPEPPTRVVAYPALVSRDKLDQVLQKVVEVGVSAVVPVLAERCVVRSAPEPRQLARWSVIMREAGEQCGRGRIPALESPLTLEAALRRAAAEGPVLLASPEADTRPLADVLAGLTAVAGASIGLFVGPEGGFSPREVSLAQRLGAHVVSLGPFILRTETASPVFAALVLALLDRAAPGELSPEEVLP